MPTPAPGFTKHPGYLVTIEPSQVRVRVHAGDTLVADSTSTLKVSESNLSTVWYLPMSDVNQQFLEKTTTSTYCPFKGHASYWRIAADTIMEDAVWGYENPYDECIQLQHHLAFYTNRVNVEVESHTKQG